MGHGGATSDVRPLGGIPDICHNPRARTHKRVTGGERFVVGAPINFSVKVLTEDEWPVLRDIRLSALEDSPQAFLSSFAHEVAYNEGRWRREFVRGEWAVAVAADQVIGLLGATRESAMPSHECYLEYLWVWPETRRSGVASMLLRTALDRLRDSGVRTVWLWILDGNDSAMRLYQGFGFQSTNERQRLPADPARSEERLRLSLS
jgi:ribosomal protein S18 acetylase RimI-like enzyme